MLCKYCSRDFKDHLQLKQHLQMDHKDIPSVEKLTYFKKETEQYRDIRKLSKAIKRERNEKKLSFLSKANKAIKAKEEATGTKKKIQKKRRYKSVFAQPSAIETNRSRH